MRDSLMRLLTYLGNGIINTALFLPQVIKFLLELLFYRLTVRKRAKYPEAEEFYASRQERKRRTKQLTKPDFSDKTAEISAAMMRLSPEEKTVYVLNLFHSEMLTSGLCRFLSGPYQHLMSDVLQALLDVKAVSHYALLTRFLQDNRIDVSDLSHLRATNRREFAKQAKRCPYAAFDDEYYKLQSLQAIAADYQKQ